MADDKALGLSVLATVRDWVKSLVSGKQDALVSGTNIKTVNSTSLLGSGNVSVQPTLVSGTNIKTINNNSLLGSGNITIEGGGSDEALTTQEIEAAVDAAYAVTDFTITVSQSSLVTANKSTAEEGDTVVVTVITSAPLEPGMNGLGVLKTDDMSVLVASLTTEPYLTAGDTYTFTMPAYDVTIGFY